MSVYGLSTEIYQGLFEIMGARQLDAAARLFDVIFLRQREAPSGFLSRRPAMHGAGRMSPTCHAVCAALRFSARELCPPYMFEIWPR